ncbi:elongation of very long chain fatty acids protein F-like [Teleopsis dalmanni]|uniref:elongation of very long chain fatty acids protein F-like n=1 Tax=Teleopsis dalmanni TaxID=139649 RepID=UPI0018CE783A|nr:elongation of very long chain fatty acids protein F-like [Teleopsis dalmanni]XP_037953826.1 elongation of very long chain fatty acids protein F-like [Teleopsis dalmanni]
MFLILTHIFKQIKEWDERHYVKTTTNIPIVGSPVKVIAVTVAYILFVLKIGPYLMRNREPFNVKLLMQVYNVFQVLVNLYMGVMGFKLLWVPDQHSFGCITSLPVTHRLKSFELFLCYLYFLVKIIDYMDTIFFVLRKSFKQITFLHVYHHVLMVLVGVMVSRYYGTGGHQLVTGDLNAFIHVIMYSYYFFSALNPNIKTSKWKRFITTAQIIQFILIIIHQLWALFISKGCTYPKILLYLNLSQAMIMIILFSNFYIKTYIRRKSNIKEDRHLKST